MKIGVIALSLPNENGRGSSKITEKKIKYLENMGHEVVRGNTLTTQNGYKSSDIQTRVQDIMQMFRDRTIDVIMNVTGGYNSNEILEYLDYEEINRNPKTFVGFSDITAVNLALEKNASNITTVYGANLRNAKSYPQVLDAVFDILENPEKQFNQIQRQTGKSDLAEVKILENKRRSAQGEIIAANLSTFNLMIGTKNLPDLSGKILFLEYDKEENRSLPSLERMLWQIRQAGIFDKIKGLVFGKPQAVVEQEENETDNISRILAEVSSGYNFPVLYNVPFGHIEPSWNLINGTRISIQGDSLSVITKEEIAEYRPLAA